MNFEPFLGLLESHPLEQLHAKAKADTERAVYESENANTDNEKMAAYDELVRCMEIEYGRSRLIKWRDELRSNKERV